MSHQTTAGFEVFEPAVRSNQALNPPTIRGDVLIDLRSARTEFDLTERRCEYVCASGDRFGGRWRGISLSELVAESEIAPDSTHLLVESDDGFRVCVEILDLLDGILATERLDSSDELSRLIAPAIDGTRTIKRVARIEGRRLASEDDPEDLERIVPPSKEGVDD
jgi:DMSO/TMAO reductase YedYZ molybdopterin-dependent catalytic subunit